MEFVEKGSKYATKKAQKQTLCKLIQRRPDHLMNLGHKPTCKLSRPNIQPPCRRRSQGGNTWVRPHPRCAHTPSCRHCFPHPRGVSWWLLHDGYMQDLLGLFPQNRPTSSYKQMGETSSFPHSTLEHAFIFLVVSHQVLLPSCNREKRKRGEEQSEGGAKSIGSSLTLYRLLAVTINPIRPPIIVQNRRNKQSFDTCLYYCHSSTCIGVNMFCRTHI